MGNYAINLVQFYNLVCMKLHKILYIQWNYYVVSNFQYYFNILVTKFFGVILIQIIIPKIYYNYGSIYLNVREFS